MSGPEASNSTSNFSSKLTCRLVEQAESLMNLGDMDNQQIEQRFAAMGQGAVAALNSGQGEQKDLAMLRRR